MPCLDADDGEPCRSQAAVKPLRQRASLQPDAPIVPDKRAKQGRDGLRLALDLRLLQNLAVRAHHTNTCHADRYVQTNKQIHRTASCRKMTFRSVPG